MDRDVVAPSVLDAPEHEDLGARGRHLHHLLEADLVDLARGRDDARVGGEDAVDVGVDLADVGVEGGGEGDGRGVGAAAAERRDVLRRLAHALESGDDGDVAVVEGGADPPRSDVDDPRLAELLIGDDSGLGTGERLGFEAEVGDRHREHGHRDPLSGGEEHVELTRRGRGETCWARSMRSSVLSPIAETTTTTSWPACRYSTMRWATRLTDSASATEDPPNFWTTKLTEVSSCSLMRTAPIDCSRSAERRGEADGVGGPASPPL